MHSAKHNSQRSIACYVIMTHCKTYEPTIDIMLRYNITLQTDIMLGYNATVPILRSCGGNTLSLRIEIAEAAGADLAFQ